MLMVGGFGFSERSGRLSYLVCRFNSSMVSAVYVSGVELHCITPEHVSGLVSVEVSMNSQPFSTDGVQYEYVEVSLYGVSPVSGPVRGGTLVTLSGVGLYGSESTNGGERSPGAHDPLMKWLSERPQLVEPRAHSRGSTNAVVSVVLSE